MFKRFILTICLFAGGSALIQAQPCVSPFSSLLGVGEKLVEAYNDARTAVASAFFGKGVGAAAEKSFEFQELAYSEVKNLLNIGPIDMHYDMYSRAAFTGKLEGEGGGVVGGNRTFILAPGLYDRTYITIKKTSGKAGANFTACVKNADGNTEKSKSNSIDKGESTIGNEKEFTFWFTGDKWITLNIVKTDGFNDFGYSIVIRGEYNEDRLKELYDAEEAKKSSADKNPKTQKDKEKSPPTLGTTDGPKPQGATASEKAQNRVVKTRADEQVNPNLATKGQTATSSQSSAGSSGNTQEDDQTSGEENRKRDKAKARAKDKVNERRQSKKDDQ